MVALRSSPEVEMATSARNLLVVNCHASTLVETNDAALSRSPLRNTSRVFPRERIAWALMALDEEDVPRAHPNRMPTAH